MVPSDDLKRVLASVADATRPAGDPTEDLARARTAARRRTRRRFRLGLTGVTAALAVGLGTALLVPDTDNPDDTAAPTGVELVAERLEATPYTFDLTPQGWSVQAQRPSAVTIAPDDGSTSSDPDVFVGKLVILFDTNPPAGRELHLDGRDFWVSSSSDYTTLATLTRGEEPPGVVRIQYPDDAGWDLKAMAAFLGSVHVGPGARHGFG